MSGGAEAPILLIGTRASGSSTSGAYEGVELINSADGIRISPKMKNISPEDTVEITEDGKVITSIDVDTSDGNTGFSVIMKK